MVHEIEEYDNVFIGCGAGGIAAAKLMSVTHAHEKNIMFEQHSEPGGCAGYFARGNPRRIYDAGATQLVGLNKGQLQYNLFNYGKLDNSEEFSFQQIKNITFHFPEDNSVVEIDSHGKVKVTQGHIPEEEIVVLEKIFLTSAYYAKAIWNLFQEVPKFPPKNLKELRHLIKLFFKLKFSLKILYPIFILLPAKTFFRIIGLKNHHLKSIKIINSLLLDTAQNSMNKVPTLLAVMGLSILNYGIVRLDGGMRSYFKRMSVQIIKNGMPIQFSHELIKIDPIPKGGFLIDIHDKKNASFQKILVRKNLFLNLTLWNIAKLIPVQFIPKIELKSETEKAWGACALYGYFQDEPSFPRGPWYHQIFPEPNDNELTHGLYVSIYQQNKNENYRYFTATIHVELENFSKEKSDLYMNLMKKRIEKSLKIIILETEFASPKTYEKFTLRYKGYVGGVITQMANFIFSPVSSTLKNGTSCVYIVGDSVFPGQGVISCSLSGIIAWERATGLKFGDNHENC